MRRIGYTVVNVEEIEGSGPGGAVRFVPVKVGSFLRVDPDTRRCPVAGTEGMSFVSIAARRGSYEPRGPF